jgi:hypothetical protein
VIGSDEGPIYDMEGHFQMFPLQLLYEVTNDFDIWKQGNDIVANISRGDLVLFSPDDFQSYLKDFYEYSFEHLDLFYEDEYHPPLLARFYEALTSIVTCKIVFSCCLVLGRYM